MGRATERRSGALVERVERRVLWAGDVSVFVDGGGNLIVVGDDAANGLTFDRFGGFVVAGVDAGGAPTRVNGVENGQVTFDVSGEGDIRFFLRGGDDVLHVGTRSDDVTTPDDLEIYAGAGDDTIITVGDTNIGDDLEIFAGAGDDSVEVYTTEVADDLDIVTDAGDDAVTIYGSTVGDDLLVSTGSGRDRVGVGFFDADDARVFEPVRVAGTTRVDLGRDDDVLEVHRSTFGGVFFADGGSGVDRVVQGGNTFSSRPLLLRFERRVTVPA